MVKLIATLAHEIFYEHISIGFCFIFFGARPGFLLCGLGVEMGSELGNVCGAQRGKWAGLHMRGWRPCPLQMHPP